MCIHTFSWCTFIENRNAIHDVLYTVELLKDTRGWRLQTAAKKVLNWSLTSCWRDACVSTPGIDEPDPDRHRRYHLDELILAVVDQFVSHKLFFPEGDLKSCRRRFEFRAQQAAQSEDFW